MLFAKLTQIVLTICALNLANTEIIGSFYIEGVSL